jgi:hypothetical protein
MRSTTAPMPSTIVAPPSDSRATPTAIRGPHCGTTGNYPDGKQVVFSVWYQPRRRRGGNREQWRRMGMAPEAGNAGTHPAWRSVPHNGPRLDSWKDGKWCSLVAHGPTRASDPFGWPSGRDPGLDSDQSPRPLTNDFRSLELLNGTASSELCLALPIAPRAVP